MTRAVAGVAMLAVLGACDDSVAPPLPGAISPEVALAAGWAHACVLDEDGVAYCWGSNSSGQLGRTTAGESSTDPAPVSGAHRFVAIDATANTTCALTVEGAAYCWGANDRGQLGGYGSPMSSAPVHVATPEPLVEIDGGYRFVCGLAASGDVYCWGHNHVGQAGIGPTDAPTLPVRVEADVRFDAISAGLTQACGLSAGVAYCWGGGSFGSLGTGDTQDRVLPTAVAGGHRFTQLVTGTSTTCGVTVGGATYCWGLSFFGSAGSGEVAQTQILEPARLSVDPGFVWSAPGDENSTLTVACGLDATGAASCWGPNAYGGLGTAAAMESCGPLNAGGSAFPCTGEPLPVEGGLRFSVLRPSDGFACGITTDRALYCWGENGSGQLGVPPPLDWCDVVGEPVSCSFRAVRTAGDLILP